MDDHGYGAMNEAMAIDDDDDHNVYGDHGYGLWRTMVIIMIIMAMNLNKTRHDKDGRTDIRSYMRFFSWQTGHAIFLSSHHCSRS